MIILLDPARVKSTVKGKYQHTIMQDVGLEHCSAHALTQAHTTLTHLALLSSVPDDDATTFTPSHNTLTHLALLSSVPDDVVTTLAPYHSNQPRCTSCTQQAVHIAATYPGAHRARHKRCT